tara:strand:- start:58 stop:735 length:678 start_codon:yes stop_codon:yes gene_type:complete
MHQLIDKKNKVVIYLLLLLILSTISGKFEVDQKIHSTKLNKISIEGLSDIQNSKILKELDNLIYKNILMIKKEEINEVLKKYNIIEEYRVKKIYPLTISLNIKPTKFIARVSNNNNLLIGSNGKIIKNKENKEILPYIFGEFNSKEFLFFKKNIDQSKFSFLEFKILYFYHSNRWDILTNENILIKLPQNKLSDSLNLAYNIMKDNEFKDIKLIDLRVGNHLVVK